MTQLQQGGGGTEAAIHATSRGWSCNPRHRSCKSRPPVLQTAVAGAAKAVRSCCILWPPTLQTAVARAAKASRSCKRWPAVLQPPVAGASKAGRRCCNLPSPELQRLACCCNLSSSELQRPSAAAANPHHRSCKNRPPLLQPPVARSCKGRATVLPPGAAALPSVGVGAARRGGGAFNRS